jgi:hypothetical protein
MGCGVNGALRGAVFGGAETYQEATVVAIATDLVLPWAMMICSRASLVLMKKMVNACGGG